MKDHVNSTTQIAIIGAGPIGLEAALYGIEAGCDVNVFERGRVATNVNDWGHVRLFSPFALNASEWGCRALRENDPGCEIPASDAVLTGREFLERYLEPLSQLPQLNGRIHEKTEVRAVGRSQTWKGDLIGQSSRADDCFQLLLWESGNSHGGERIAHADFVLDCSGTYPHHNWVGAGGIPCVGETASLTDDDYRLPDILGSQRAEFSGKRTLVFGSGFSAATAVVSIAELAASDVATRAIWLTRSDRTPPMTVIENDALPERARLVDAANRLALDGSNESHVDWRPGRLVIAIKRSSNEDSYLVRSPSIHEGEPAKGRNDEFVVDRVIANVGYRPHRRLYEELQVHECYATDAPIKLAAALLGETSSDCLSQTSQGIDTLRNPEPGFFILGSKSYGRDSRFLLKVGFEQIQDVFELISGN